MLLERIIVVLAVLRRRWWLGLLPVVAALPLAFAIVKLAPTKYVTSSIILFQPANRASGWAGSGDMNRQNAQEQLGAVEAWLKSEHVLLELLPKLRNDNALPDPITTAVEMALLRKSLTFELTGNSVLVIRLEGANREGLGRKLEIIVSRLMEGLIRPDADILSASQLIALRRSEAATEAERMLMLAINQSGVGNASTVVNQLSRLHEVEWKRDLQSELLPPSGARPSLGAARPSVAGTGPDVLGDAAVQALRNQISTDPAVVKDLERLFAGFAKARGEYDTAVRELSPKETNYVGIFEAPEKLKIIGRPKDPQLGEKQATRIALALIFLSLIAGAGLIFLSIMFDNRLHFGHEFAALSGVPVVARLPKLAQIGPATLAWKEP